MNVSRIHKHTLDASIKYNYGLVCEYVNGHARAGAITRFRPIIIQNNKEYERKNKNNTTDIVALYIVRVLTRSIPCNELRKKNYSAWSQ